MNDVTAKLPEYQSHKTVWALKLARLTKATMYPEDSKYSPFPVEGRMIEHIANALESHPDDPGYFVQYADGYTSWSPTEAFENGYTLVTIDAPAVDSPC